MNIEEMSVNAIRVLSADAIQKANSGHPGLPLGTAPIAYELFSKHMNYNPQNPEWVNRDRFVLSGGHGSMLLYSLFHLFGIGNLSLDEVKSYIHAYSKRSFLIALGVMLCIFSPVFPIIGDLFNITFMDLILLTIVQAFGFMESILRTRTL